MKWIKVRTVKTENAAAIVKRCRSNGYAAKTESTGNGMVTVYRSKEKT